MSTNGTGVERLIQAGAPVEPLEEQKARARLRASMFGVRPDPVKLGRFTVLQRLGSGGAGVVYAAWDPQLDRKVALKVLRSADDARAHEPQLVREAKALAKLAHPNVVSVFDVVQMSSADDPTVRLALTMEYVEGETLGVWLRRDRPHWREVVRVFVAAGRGLAAAHAVGLTHRDFKPSNVIVGSDGRVRVLDFGLARPSLGASPGSGRGSEIAGMQHSTAASMGDHSVGRIAGTPSYMAPEQHQGEPWDPKMDQYAFCVALWEALEGTLPFAGDTPAELYRDKMQGPPVRRIHALPSRLRKALARGLQPEPSARFASMDALLDALRVEPRRQLWLAAGAATVVLASAFGAWSRTAEETCTGGIERLDEVWDVDRRGHAREAFVRTKLAHAERSWQTVETTTSTWVETWSSEHRDACRAHAAGEQSSELLDLRMACLGDALRELRAFADVLVDADEVVVDRAVAAASSLPNLERCADTTTLRNRPRDPVDPSMLEAVERVRMLVAESMAEQTAGRYPRGLAVAEAALGEAELLTHATTLAAARHALGSALDRMGELELARAELVRAARDAQAAAADDLFVQTAIVLVWVLGDRQARFEEARAWADLAEGALERLGGDARLSADLHAARGAVAYSDGRYDDAIEHHEACARLSSSVWGARHFKTFRCHVNLANVHNRRGDLERALEVYRLAIETAKHTIGETHPYALIVRSNMVGVLEQLGRRAEALEEGLAVLAAQEMALGPEHPDLGSILINIASAYGGIGEREKAVTLVERALTIQEQAWGVDNIWLATTLVNLAQNRLLFGDIEGATVAAERALALQRTAFGDAHGELAHSLVVLGRIALAREDYGGARDHLERAGQLASEAFGPDHFLVTRAKTHLALLPEGQ